jgi:arginine deiminase
VTVRVTVLTVSTSELGSNSEVGALRVAILHRPGAELRRLTPRNNDDLRFDGLPWVARVREEHDAFAELLRSRGVEVLLLSDLLTEALQSGAAGCRGSVPPLMLHDSDYLWRKSSRPSCVALARPGWPMC